MREVVSNGISRRSFLALSGVVAASTLAGCGSSGLEATEEAVKEESSTEVEGTWVTALCDYNCGGLCLNKAYVVDGAVVRQKTDDTHEDSELFPQQRGCARGRAQRKLLYGVERLKYPMKRKHWEVGGGDKELRGQDTWVRISWDEALDIISSEYKRIIETYGNQAILRGPSCYAVDRFSLAMGGLVRSWGTVSYGSFPIPDLCQDFGHFCLRFYAAKGSTSQAFKVLSKNASITSAGTR